LRKLAAAGAVLGVAVATSISSASAVVINVRPYVGNQIGVGATAPGDPSSELCLILAATPTSYTGKINGAPGGPAGQLDVFFYLQDLTTTSPTCVPTSISVDATGTATPTTTGGSLAVTSTTSVQPGIQAQGITLLRVNYDTNMSVKQPSGSTVVGGALSGGSFVDLQMKPIGVSTKAQLDTAACSDNQYLIDANTNDGSKSNGPTATDIDDPASPNLGDPGVYVATLRNCAQLEVSVPGKPVTSKISVVGHGAVSVQFLKSLTANPQTWDTTRGKACSAVKTAGTYGDALDSSRVLQCKGDFGAPIPLNIDVRNWVANTPGQLDTYGLLHPGPAVTILSGSV
jgi:hypothetical protein